MTTLVSAIQTKAFGCLFRSRLEARCAVFLEAMGLQWEYEPEGYELPSGRYLPDFKVYKNDCPAGYYWIECKGGVPTDQEVRLARELAKATTACVMFFRHQYFQLMREQCANYSQFFKHQFGSKWNGIISDPWVLTCDHNDLLFGGYHKHCQMWDRYSVADQDLLKLGFDYWSAAPHWPLSQASKAATAALSARFERGETFL